ncbi:MAG: 4Fe-4S binding protein, partial [Spirochaetaceae bacterium]|nr:4Fe-4S binding protein [Spirochaetaceae bacterium]
MNGEMLHWVFLIVLFVCLIITRRLFCGKVCPAGYAQDLIFKIPFFIKVKTFRIDTYLRLLKYLNLLLVPLLAF